MKIEELTELFVHAAEVDRRLPDTARPAKLKAMAIPYYHDWTDMAGWGSERYQEERQSFWDSRSTRLKTSDISDWERANELMVHVPNEDQRRCLWHWAIAKAGGRPFSKWCRDEGILRETGRWRKENAIKAIYAAVSCVDGAFTHQIAQEDALPNHEDLSHKSSIIGAVMAWIAPGSRPQFCDIDRDLERYDWAEVQNARRREREKRKRVAA